MLRRHIGQQIDVHLPWPQAHYTPAGIKSLLKIGEAGVLDATGGGGGPERLEPSPPWLRPCLKSRVRRQFKLSTFRFKPVLRHICLEKVQTCPYNTSMLATPESSPHVLFAWHWYIKWLFLFSAGLLMLVIFNHRPIMTLLTSPDHVTVGAGTPVALQYKDTLPPSTTDILVIGCTDAGTEEQKLPTVV